MDNDGFVLEKISEKSTVTTPPKRTKRRIAPQDLQNGSITNDENKSKIQAPNVISPIKTLSERVSTNSGHSSHNGSTTNNSFVPQQPAASTRAMKSQNYNKIELTDAKESEGEEDQQQNNVDIMNNSLTTSNTDGGERFGDELEVHQLSAGDIDAYLDIYFETLDNRLRHLVGGDAQLREFRTAMKERINSNSNAREYQTVLLGKIHGEVLAAVTMSFNGDPPTINLDQLEQQRTCASRFSRWMVNKANYVPAYAEECYIEMIGVKANYRRQGIGTAMLECVEHFARKAGARLLTIHIHGRMLRDYFQRYGFQVDHTDYSPLWKWLLERQTTEKMNKIILADEDDQDGGDIAMSSASYANEPSTME